MTEETCNNIEFQSNIVSDALSKIVPAKKAPAKKKAAAKKK